MSTPVEGLRRSVTGQAPDHAAGRARRGLLAAGWVGLLGGVLALAAATVVVLSDDVRWLRLGVVAALWAGLFAVIVGVRWGARSLSAADAEAERLRHAYESELESEVAARREFEESLEHDLRRQLEAELAAQLEERHSDEIAGLRAEVERLQLDRVPDPRPLAPAPAPTRAPEPAPRAPQQRMTALDSGPGIRAVAPPAARSGASMPLPQTVPPPPPPPVVPAGPAVPVVPAGPVSAGPVSAARLPAAPVPSPARHRTSPDRVAVPRRALGPTPPSPGADEPRRPSPGPERSPASRPPHEAPEARAAALGHGSFLDQYLQTGRGVPQAPTPAAAATSTERSVAELLAAHASGPRGAPRAHHRA